jgi:hypothetical protein
VRRRRWRRRRRAKCAMMIQRIHRGNSARKAVAKRRTVFDTASTEPTEAPVPPPPEVARVMPPFSAKDCERLMSLVEAGPAPPGVVKRP